MQRGALTHRSRWCIAMLRSGAHVHYQAGDARGPELRFCCLVQPGLILLHFCRLFLRSYLKTLHLTVLLCLFCAAAYKREHTGLLAACLVSEVHSVFQICGRMQVRRAATKAPCLRGQCCTARITQRRSMSGKAC